MKERPIIFSGSMVRAILAGTKTQTRRTAKLNGAGRVKEVGRPRNWHVDDPECVLACQYGKPGDRLWVRETFVIETSFNLDFPGDPPHNDGRPTLWREDFDFGKWYEQPHYRATDETPDLAYEDIEGPSCKWRPPLAMPRWASRITLEITDVRFQRLQDISEEDCLAEGIKEERDDGVTYYGHGWPEPEGAFIELWNSIYAKKCPWESNPYVWALTFKRFD